MDTRELTDLVLRTTADVAEMRRQLTELVSREQRVAAALRGLQQRIEGYLAGFDRTAFAVTDQRLLIKNLAAEILIFEKLGYPVDTTASAWFILALAAFLDGRNMAALEFFKRFIDEVEGSNPNLRHAHYLSGMIAYNCRDFAHASERFEAAFRYSPDTAKDWQSKIYEAELAFFRRRPREVVERAFFDAEEGLKGLEIQSGKTATQSFLWATLNMKKGNCYAGTFMPPREPNSLVNNPLAVDCYKQARHWCRQVSHGQSLLPVVVDYSLAQALLVSGTLDTDLAQTPSELMYDVFHRLRRVLLDKREEIILAQGYFMLGTCAVFSSRVNSQVGEIYLEHARHQTLTVPSDMSFFSCVTKEMLSRDEFVRQIDFYANQLAELSERR